MRFCCRSRCIQMDIRTQKTNMNKQKMTSETTLHGGVKKDPTGRMKRWGLVLAGGDGVRLRRLTRLISGDDRPKQFCSLFGGATLLGHARQRAERSIPGHQVLYSLTHEHEHTGAHGRFAPGANPGSCAALFRALRVCRNHNQERGCCGIHFRRSAVQAFSDQGGALCGDSRRGLRGRSGNASPARA